MKKLKELDADAFLDFVVAVTPILPLVLKSESLRASILGTFNDSVAEARQRIVKNSDGVDDDGLAVAKKGKEKEVERAYSDIAKESAEMFGRDLFMLVPQLASREYRSAVYEALSILEEKPIEELKSRGGTYLISSVREVIEDIDFKDFLGSVEQQEATE